MTDEEYRRIKERRQLHSDLDEAKHLSRLAEEAELRAYQRLWAHQDEFGNLPLEPEEAK